MITFQLNGQVVNCEVASNRTLLDLLREDLGFTSVKKGCDQGECGVCTVLIDDSPVKSCLVLAQRIDGRSVTTIEGLEHNPLMVALRNSFLENGAIQCGFCTPGVLISAYSLLREIPQPSAEEVKKAIEGNLCRCTGYVLIIKAILNTSTSAREHQDTLRAIARS